MASEPSSLAARHRGRGFTLVEMVVVVAIVGIVAAAAQPLVALSSRRQKETELRQGLRGLRVAIDAYQAAAASGKVARPPGREGATPPGGDSGFPPTLEALVEGVPDAQAEGRKLYFMRRLPRDPFADASLPAALTWGLRSYASPPDAPQAGRDVFDVYSRTEGVGLDGTPYRTW